MTSNNEFPKGRSERATWRLRAWLFNASCRSSGILNTVPLWSSALPIWYSPIVHKRDFSRIESLVSSSWIGDGSRSLQSSQASPFMCSNVNFADVGPVSKRLLRFRSLGLEFFMRLLRYSRMGSALATNS